MSDAEEDVDKLFESSDEDEAPQQQQRSQGATPDADAAPDQLRESQPDGSDAQQAPTPSEGGTPAAKESLTANRCRLQLLETSRATSIRKTAGPQSWQSGSARRLHWLRLRLCS